MSSGDTASVHRHRQSAPARIAVAVVTVSDTRTPETDSGGALLGERLAEAGHRVLSREIVPDDVDAIRGALTRSLEREDVQAVVLTGGTGVALRDVTPEAVRGVLDREIPGFGELFRWLSFQEIGSAALLSRALAGLARGRVVVALPGSRGAIRLALEALLLPELPHLVAEAAKGGAPSGRAAKDPR